MAKYTREAVSGILGNDELTPKQKEDKLFALYGQAISEGYISVTEAQTATQNAVDAAKKEWEANIPKVNVLETPEYKELQGQFDGYKTRQEARNSADYAEIKPKFFDRVYDLLDHSDKAKPITEQLAELKKDYEEYFNPADPAPKMPQFGAKPEGAMPKGEEGAVAAFTSAWGFPAGKK